MGHTLEQWSNRVLRWLRDVSSRDVQADLVADVGIEPALSTFTEDRTPELVEELTGNGTAYLPASAAWSAGGIISVEYPVGLRPTSILDPGDYVLTRSTDDVDVVVLALFGATPGATEKIRVTYFGDWPMPTSDPTVDLVPDAAFPMVTALAAAYVCRHLATEAARDRAGSMPSDFIGGRDRTNQLLTVATTLEDTYRRWVGLGPSGDNAGEGPASIRPAWGRIDTNPGAGSIFHGGRR